MSGGNRGAAPVNTPRRFEVTLETIEGRASSYGVVTWFGRDKAVALAASVHRERVPSERIHLVRVVDHGEPHSEEGRGYVLEPDDYTDRNEW